METSTPLCWLLRPAEMGVTLKKSNAYRPEAAAFNGNPINQAWATAVKKLESRLFNEVDFDTAQHIFGRKDVTWAACYSIAVIHYDMRFVKRSNKVDVQAIETRLDNLAAKLQKYRTGHAWSVDFSASIQHLLCVDYQYLIGDAGFKVPTARRWWTLNAGVVEALYLFSDYLSCLADYTLLTSPGSRHFTALKRVTEELLIQSRKFGQHPGDIALMYHYLSTHRRPLDEDAQGCGRRTYTSYTGIAREMTFNLYSGAGRDRLLRKLSVDVNDIIPTIVSDLRRRQQLLDAAQGLASNFGLLLSRPKAMLATMPVEPEAVAKTAAEEEWVVVEQMEMLYK